MAERTYPNPSMDKPLPVKEGEETKPFIEHSNEEEPEYIPSFRDLDNQ